jgi:type IV/VI secretion system ImpK/VasF family protein
MLTSFYHCFRRGLLLSSLREKVEPPGAARPDGREEEKASAVWKYRAELSKKLIEDEHRLRARWGPEASGAARRMVTIWLDEILIQAPWPGRKHWLRKPLQSEWGEGRSGGVWFFRQLEGLNPARLDDRELAGLALRCISLGLSGCHGRDPERLDQVRCGLQERFCFKDDIPIFPPPLPPGRKKTYLGASGLKFLVALAAILSIVWLADDYSLERDLNKIAAEAEAASGREAGPAAPGLHGDPGRSEAS